MFPYFACSQQSEFRIILHYSPTQNLYETNLYAPARDETQLDDEVVS